MSLDPKYIEKVRAFIAQPTEIFGHRQWLVCKQMQCYMRLGTRRIMLPDIVSAPYIEFQTVEVANVEVSSKWRGKGLYNEFLSLVERCAGNRVVYVENVLKEDQYALYLQRGFVAAPNTEPQCFYKLPKG